MTSGFRFTGAKQFGARVHTVFSSKNAPTDDIIMKYAETVKGDKRVAGVGSQKIIVSEQEWYLNLVVQAKDPKKRFGTTVIQTALRICGLEGKEEGFGVLELTDGATVTPLKQILGDISTRRPGPKAAVQPGDKSSSDDDEPKKRKAPAHKAQPRHKRDKKHKRDNSSSTQIHPAAVSSKASGNNLDADDFDRSSNTAVVQPTKSNGAAAAATSTGTERQLAQLPSPAIPAGSQTDAATDAALQDQLQTAVAATQREKAQALTDLQTAADIIASLRAEMSAALQEKHALTARAGQLSTESIDLKTKLSTAEDNLHSSATELTAANTKLSALETALACAGAKLDQQVAANAVLTTASTEFEREAAANAESLALLGKQLSSMIAKVKKALHDEVHDGGETNSDVLKQADTLASSVGMLCDAHQEVTAAATIEGDTVPNNPASVAERTEAVAEQQQLQLLKVHDNLRGIGGSKLLLRTHELEAVRRVVTEAIAGHTGISVHVHGPTGSGKWTLLTQVQDALSEWCEQHNETKPVSIYCFRWNHPAGLYGSILEKLKQSTQLQSEIGTVSETAAEAKKQLEAVVFKTSNSSSNSSSSDEPMIVLQIYDKIEHLVASYAHELQQLYEWANSAGSRLILFGRGETDLTHTLPGLQQTGVVPAQVAVNPYTRSDVVAILHALVNPAVQPAALALCGKHASGDAGRACKLCHLAVKLALSACSAEVTLSHMEQAVRFNKFV